jgi:hypothetical protein
LYICPVVDKNKKKFKILETFENIGWLLMMIMIQIVTNTFFLSMDKERRIRKFALIVVDCFHKEYHRLEYNPPSTIPRHISFHFYCINYQNICQDK